ncbi:DUF1146 family protein [Vagococcus salmoninarum]|uniref:DUF1146 domain-containing protein n=1 Tax=Vagococcus salmoninarum TaxID=2739 RepID=A0A429ZMU1_9ENTE|nr:DUF1146 family protein [Vagococcus salmoninarum]MBE9389477.1 DUF1146 domain-containing protein [Vagococcus salmoninarum]RST94988.1 hypothetical protein CBF35_08955 [Vagococcus salmoninarum]
MSVYGVEALVRLTSHFAFIYLTFWAMQSFRTDTFFKRTNSIQIRMIFVLIAIAIGYTASSFFMECLELMRNFWLTMLR